MVHKIFEVDIFDGIVSNGNLIFYTCAFQTNGYVIVATVAFDPLPIEVEVAG